MEKSYRKRGNFDTKFLAARQLISPTQAPWLSAASEGLQNRTKHNTSHGALLWNEIGEARSGPQGAGTFCLRFDNVRLPNPCFFVFLALFVLRFSLFFFVHFSGVPKGWFSKGVVLADVPPERKPERGYVRMHVPPERKTATRARSPKPPFWKATLLATPEFLLSFPRISRVLQKNLFLFRGDPRFFAIHIGTPLEGPTRKPRHASVFSTHSDTQAVPAFHCKNECLKTFFSTR